MKLKVNGKDQELSITSISVYELLSENKVQRIDMVSVQLNKEFIRKEDFQSVLLKENDEVDFLFFMGGGQDLSVNGYKRKLTQSITFKPTTDNNIKI